MLRLLVTVARKAGGKSCRSSEFGEIPKQSLSWYKLRVDAKVSSDRFQTLVSLIVTNCYFAWRVSNVRERDDPHRFLPKVSIEVRNVACSCVCSNLIVKEANG